MKQIIGVLLLASAIGLAIAATSSASTDKTPPTCPAVKAEIFALAANAKKAAHVGDYALEIRIYKEVVTLTATAKAVCAGSNAPAAGVKREELPVAHRGQSYPPQTYCPHIVDQARKQCNDDAGRLITFKTTGDLLPIGMRFDPFTGTISGTPPANFRVPQTLKFQVCWSELQGGRSGCVGARLTVH